jgi:hypothetical protein
VSRDPDLPDPRPLRRADAVRAARVGDELVLLDLRRNSYFTLNATGALVWDRLAAGATLAELGEALTRAFEVDAETAARDARELVGELLDAGLVERVEPR